MDFFDDFDKMFSRLYSSFNRPVKDQRPFVVYTSEKGYTVVVNTLGIDKEDLKVNIQYEKSNSYPILCIKGSSDIEKIKFKNDVSLKILMNFNEPIERLDYECKNGLTLIYLKVKHEEPKTIDAQYIEDSSAFEW